MYVFVCAAHCVCIVVWEQQTFVLTANTDDPVTLSNHQFFVTFGMLTNSSFGIGLGVDFAITRNPYLATIISSLLGMIGYIPGKCGWFTEDDLRPSCDHTLYGI